MKITIEFTSSYHADIEIAGKKITLEAQHPAIWKMRGVRGKIGDRTSIAGMIASKLMSPLIDILQAWIPDCDSPDGGCWEPWEKLTEEVDDEVYDRMDV